MKLLLLIQYGVAAAAGIWTIMCLFGIVKCFFEDDQKGFIGNILDTAIGASITVFLIT